MRIHLPALLLTVALAAPAAGATRNFGITSFDRIRVDGPYKVVLKVGVAPFASATGSQAALDEVAVEVQGRTLVVHPSRSSWGGFPGENKGPVEIRIGTHELTQAWLNGSGSLQIDRIRGLTFDLSVQGSGAVGIGQAEVDQLRVSVGGTAAAILAGKAGKASVTVRGMSSFDGSRLASRDAAITADGPATIKADVANSATIEGYGPATITLPAAPAKIGVRIGLGGQVGTCAGTSGTAGTYACYDGSSTSTGLLMIRDYAVGTATTTTPPALDGVWPTSCSGSPFFFIVTGTCAGNVTAEVNYGTGATQPGATYHVKATVGGSAALELRPVSYDSARDAWIWSLPAGTTFALAAGGGPLPVTISWEVNDTSRTITGFGACTASGGNPCKGTFANSPHQRIYSGLDDASRSGPVRSVQLGGGGDPNGPASLVPGTTTLTITAGIAGNYQVHTSCPPPPSGKAYSCATDPSVPLRLKDSSGSTTFAVDCGGVGTGANLLAYEIENGCTNPFSLNSNGICTPANPVDPPDCAPVNNVGVGLKTGPVRTALNNRFAPGGTCLTNNYPVVDPENDKRVVLVMLTDFSAFDSGSGAGVKVPIMTMGAFYVTGWEGAVGGCNTQNDAPPGGTADTGEIWGHFITYVLVRGVGGTAICDPGGLIPCVPVLTQ